MAGSYNHVVDKNGKLYVFGDMMQMIDNDGDVYETIEEMYGMIWFLAATHNVDNPKEVVEKAQTQHKLGLGVSPGIQGFLPGSRS